MIIGVIVDFFWRGDTILWLKFLFRILIFYRDNKIFMDGYYIYVDIYVYMYNLGGIITARG